MTNEAERTDRPTLWAALLDAQRHADGLAKSGTNKSQGYDYATVEDVTRIAREALNEAGLVAVLRLVADGVTDWQRLDAYLHLVHPASGEEARFPVPWPVERPGPQGRRAAHSYARKQALLELLALAEPGDPETDATPAPSPGTGGSGKPPAQNRGGGGKTRTMRRTDKPPAATSTGDAPARRRPQPPPAPDLDPPHPPGGTQAAQEAPGAPEIHPQRTADPPTADPTPASFRALHAAYRAAGMADRKDRLAHASDVLGRPVGSASDLTAVEVSRVLDALTGPPAPDLDDEPPTPEAETPA